MLISLVVVGACFAVVLWFTLGSVSQPATKDVKAAYGDSSRPASRVIEVEAGVAVVGGEAVAVAEDDDDDEAPAAPDRPTLAAAPALIVTTDDLDPDDTEAPDDFEATDNAEAPDTGSGLDDGHDPDDRADDDAAAAGRGLWAAPALAAEPTVAVERAVPHTAAVPPSPPAIARAGDGRPLTEAPANPRRHPVKRRRRVVNLPGSYSFSPVPPVTAGRRLRSALGVLVVVTVVGLGLAAAVGILVVAISRALESAVS